ncbi:hypothetical protein F5Y01DRAFT_73454 [Xylaria sp. FL0043]|nr:hypothetical protein F5Y01DRAFT_73454 [Xylaria sp. FL0043]
METSVEFPPYRMDFQGLSYFFPFDGVYSDVNIEDIPPSADKAYSDEKLSGIVAQSQDRTKNEENENENEKENIISKLNGLTDESSEADILSLIQECHSLNLKLDLNRLARYAICKNALAVVKFLVEKGEADLSCQDIHDRSAIFYVLWDYPDTAMFEYIASKLSPRSEIINRRYTGFGTILDFAIGSRRLDAVEFLLGLGAEIDHRWQIAEWYIQSLIGFRKLISNIPQHKTEILVTKLISSEPSLPSKKMLGDMVFKENEDDLVRVEIPWANGILFFSALRQYGRHLGYPTYANNWLPSFFRQPVKVPSNPDIPYTDPMYESNFELNPELDPELRGELRCLVVFPSLVLRSRGVHEKARRRINEIRLQMLSEPMKMVLQPERTLDEAYFPSLSTSVLNTRNKSQVVSREHISEKCAETRDREPTNDDTEPILVVSQLWLWRCDRFILTAFSENMLEDGPNEHVFECLLDARDFLEYADWHPGIQTGLFLAYHIASFGKPQMRDKFPAPLDIFEASAARVLADVNEYMDPTVSSQPDMKKEQGFMFRIADIREELAMIQEVLGQQLEILQKYIEDFEKHDPDWRCWHAQPLTGAEDQKKLQRKAMKNWEKVEDSKSTLEKYQKRVRKIDGDAERVEKRMQDQLNLKRTYASIDDARSSIRLGIAGLILSTAVIGFTVVTIIFAPLAFVTALFALPIDSLIRNQIQFNGAGGSSDAEDGSQTTSVYTTRYVGTWFAVAEIVSLGVTILFVAICLWFVRGSESFAALQALDAGPKRKRHWYDFRSKPDGNAKKASVAEPKPDENIVGANAQASSIDVAESEPNRGSSALRRRVADIIGYGKKTQSSQV